MVRTFFIVNLVVEAAGTSFLNQFLQMGLVIDEQLSVYRFINDGFHPAQYEIPCLLKSAIEIYCCNKCFQSVCKDGCSVSPSRKLLSLAQEKKFAKFNLP